MVQSSSQDSDNQLYKQPITEVWLQ